MAKVRKLGWILVRENVITSKQMEKIIQFQKEDNVKTSIGDLVKTFYNVPSDIVETIFLREIVIPLTKEWFCEKLEKSGLVNVAETVSDISFQVNSYDKIKTSITTCQLRNDTYMEKPEVQSLSHIKFRLENLVVISSIVGQFAIEPIEIQYDVNSRNFTVLDNSYIFTEIKVKLSQAIKKKLAK